MHKSTTRKEKPPKRSSAGFFLAALLVVCLAGAVFLSGCSSRGNEAATSQAELAMPVPVIAALATTKNVPVEVRAIGNVEAYSTVTVKSQVEGEIQQAHFSEGQDIRQGDLLFTIDPRPFEALLRQAEAKLAQDEAEARNAQAKAARYKNLYVSGIVSKDQFDQFKTSSEALDAAVRADQAAVENTRLNLAYCTIRSPISGRAGSLLVHSGNIVKANETSLLVINQIQPIYVAFSVPEQYLADIKERMARGKLQVVASVPDQTQKPAEGVLTFLNNTVDSSTGTILLKGTFSNTDRRLWPGQFINAHLKLMSQANATVVPTQAVQTAEKGLFVYVIKSDMTTDVRPVEAGTTYQSDTVIERGVQPGERVVTDGQLRLYPGAKVTIKTSLSTGQASGS